MSGKKANLFLVILIMVLGGSFLSAFGTDLVEANPLATPSLTASAWNYLPIVRGQLPGPTFTPGPPLPTATESPAFTPSPTNTATATGQAPPATDAPTNTPKPPTETPTNTPKPSDTPTATAQPEPSNTGDVRITEIFFDGAVYRVESDEYVEIKNFDNKVIKLKGWKLHDEGVIHTYTFPAYDMQPGEVCRVYTNENHPEWCGLNWGNGSAIWNNDGDEATLKDGSGKEIDTCSYSGSGTTKNCR